MTQIIEQKYFYGGISEDSRIGPPNSVAYSEGLALNNNTSYIELAPRSEQVGGYGLDGTDAITTLIEAEGKVYALGEGGFVFRDDNGTFQNVYRLPDVTGQHPDIIGAFVFREYFYFMSMVSDSSDLKVHRIKLSDIGGVSWNTVEVDKYSITNSGAKDDVRVLVTSDVYIAFGKKIQRLTTTGLDTLFTFPTNNIAFMSNIGDTFIRIYQKNGIILDWDGLATSPTAIRNVDQVINNGLQKGTTDFLIGGYGLNTSYFGYVSGYDISILARSTNQELAPNKLNIYNNSNQNSLAFDNDTVYMVTNGENGADIVTGWGKKITGLQNATVPLINTNHENQEFKKITAIYVRNGFLYIAYIGNYAGLDRSRLEKISLNNRSSVLNKSQKGFFVTHTQIGENLTSSKFIEFGLMAKDITDTIKVKIYSSVDGGNFQLRKEYGAGSDRYRTIKIPINFATSYTEIAFKVVIENNSGTTETISPKIYGYYLKYESQR